MLGRTILNANSAAQAAEMIISAIAATIAAQIAAEAAMKNTIVPNAATHHQTFAIAVNAISVAENAPWAILTPALNAI